METLTAEQVWIQIMLVKTNGLYDHRQFKRKQGEVLAEIIKAMEVYASQFKTQNAGPRL